MNGQDRRDNILNAMVNSKTPISGSALAKTYTVSRQIIVQDIALLRAAGHNIIATNRGYTISESIVASRVFKVSHTDEQLEDELTSIIDLGGVVADAFINHKVYGRIRVDMNIKCRKDIQKFIDGIKSGKSRPLKNLTSNYHYHTVTAESEKTLDEIEKILDKKGMIVK